MKNIKYLLFIVVIQTGLYSCKKDIPQPGKVSALTIVNAMPSSTSLIADFYGTKNISTYYSTTPQINYGSYYEYSLPSGNSPITIYQTSDTTDAVFKKNVDLLPAGIYNLYLSGSNPLQPDTLLMKDDIPYLSTDSLSGVRFINLVSDSQPVTIDIQGNSNGSEVQSLSYRKITAFKTHAATSLYISNGYTFEIRDAASGNLLTTFTWSISPFHCNTIIIAGEENGPAGLKVFQVNNY